MSTIILINGAEHDFVNTWRNKAPFSYHLETIAHSLAQINRFAGHCKRPYSVAEHSLLVASFAAAEGVSPIVQLAALMHDAHESLVGDVASPVKWTVGHPWESFEKSQAHQLHIAHGLHCVMANHSKLIRRWDLEALATERRDLTAYVPGVNSPWMILDRPGAEILADDTVNLMAPTRVTKVWARFKQEFIAEYRRLRALADQECKGTGL